jgi:hypothetical protein
MMVLDEYPELAVFETDPTNAKWGLIAGVSKTYWDDLLYKLRVIELDVNTRGADNTGVTDSHAVIQAAIDDAYFYKIRIGYSKTETYTVSQPLIYPSNKEIIIDGTIILQAGQTSTVTADVSIGATSFSVSEPSKFKVGEWVGIYDDIQISGYDRLRASSGEITDITGSVITFDSVCTYNYLVSENARVSHANSVLLGVDVDNVVIRGSGVIDGNKANQAQIHPVRNVSVIEDQRSCCGIVAFRSTNITVTGVTVQNALMHNVSVSSLDGVLSAKCFDIRLINVTTKGGGEKNNLLWGVTRAWITDCYADGADWEDGINCYAFCTFIYITNFTATNNARGGVYITAWNSNGLIQIDGLTTSGNGAGLWISGRRVNVTNFTNSDGIRLAPTGSNGASVINITNMITQGVSATSGSSRYAPVACIYMLGGVKRINITNWTAESNSLPLVKTINDGTGSATNVKISTGGVYDHTGTVNDLAVGADVTFTNFTGV